MQSAAKLGIVVYEGAPISVSKQTQWLAVHHPVSPLQSETKQSAERILSRHNAICRYGTNAICRYGTNAICRYGTNAICRYGTAICRYGTNAICRYGTNAICRYGTAICRHGTAICRYGTANSFCRGPWNWLPCFASDQNCKECIIQLSAFYS